MLPLSHNSRAGRFFTRWRGHICSAIALCAIAITATAAEAPTEIKRRVNNGVRIREMHPYMQAKVGAVLSDLESHGLKPLIYPGVWRSYAEQQKKVKQGYSGVTWSFHMATSKTGKHESLAADIVDNAKEYKADSSFWLMLNSAATAHQLTTGVFWGLRQLDRDKIRQLVQSKSWHLKYKRGRDAAHTEPLPWVVTLEEAKRGKRPPVPK